MKAIMLLTSILLSSQLYAAIGCLPGDCCNGHPCGSPTTPSQPQPRPNPRIPNCDNGFVSFQSKERKVDTCLVCTEDEVCGEFKNSNDEVLGYRCITPN